MAELSIVVTEPAMEPESAEMEPVVVVVASELNEPNEPEKEMLI